MKKILIVEDNKTLAKLIAKKITADLNFEVEVAYSLKEAKLFLKMYKFFLVLTDLNLPDAPNGEIVDYALKKGNRVIVLSGSVDKDLRKVLLKKEIIDYVKKSGANDIDYIIQTVKRLYSNQNHKVMLVDDSLVFRKHMQTMLENLCFKVITVAHGEEALNILNTMPDIDLVITDYHMPVMNGLDFTIEARKIKSKNTLAIMAISSNEDDEITAMFLKQGANDYIKKPFSKEEFSCRVNNIVDNLENIYKIVDNSNRDFLTGLHNRRYFFDNMQTYFSSATETGEKFAIGMIDIDNFKFINDKYGHSVGDDVIKSLANTINDILDSKHIAARFGGEEFCVVLKNIEASKATDIFDLIRHRVEETGLTCKAGNKLNYTVSIGVSINHDYSLDGTIHEADMMLYEAKQNGKNQVIHN